MPVNKTIQTRRDTSFNWSSVNPILAIGEAGLETNTGKLKYGDGITAWNSLAYFAPQDLSWLAPKDSPTFTGTATANNFNVTGTLQVTSNTLVTNLNADLLDGQHGSYYTANSDFVTLSGNVSTLSSNFSSHTANTANPHATTATQIGLGNVTNESKSTMFSSPTFTGTATANNLNVTGILQVTSNALVSNLNADYLDGQHASYYTANSDFTTLSGNVSSLSGNVSTLSSNLSTHAANTANPHSVTATQVGLGNVTNESKSTMFSNPAFTGTATANNITTSGDLVVAGNLTVNGTTVTANSVTLIVKDKNIELGAVSSPTDATADGGGITLHGTSDKTITWDQVNSNWTSSEHWNIASGKVLKIGNASVLSSNTLGSSVVSSSLTSVGTITSGTWSGSFGAVSGANLTSLTAGNLTGTIPSTVLGNSSVYIGTTALALNRAGASQSLTGVSIDGSAGSVAASSITGTTLASNVVSSSLTSVGTLGNLTVTNPISGSVTGTASNITGTYAGTLTSSQITTGLGFTPYNSTNPSGYITSSGSITGSAGSVAGTNITGTTLASNIVNSSLTGVGTLTSGTINWTSNITTTGVGYFGPASALSLTNPLIVATGNVDGYNQVQVQNKSTGTSASSDWIATADNGTDTSKYIDLGINNSGYSSGTWTISGANDGYLYIDGGTLTLGTSTSGKSVAVHTGGTLAANIVTTFNAAGTASANTTTGAVVVTGGLGVSANITANTGNFVNGLTTFTASAGTANTQVATTAFVQAVKDVVIADSLAFAVALG